MLDQVARIRHASDCTGAPARSSAFFFSNSSVALTALICFANSFFRAAACSARARRVSSYSRMFFSFSRAQKSANTESVALHSASNVDVDVQGERSRERGRERGREREVERERECVCVCASFPSFAPNNENWLIVMPIFTTGKR